MVQKKGRKTLVYVRHKIFLKYASSPISESRPAKENARRPTSSPLHGCPEFWVPLGGGNCARRCRALQLLHLESRSGFEIRNVTRESTIDWTVFRSRRQVPGCCPVKDTTATISATTTTTTTTATTLQSIFLWLMDKASFFYKTETQNQKFSQSSDRQSQYLLHTCNSQSEMFELRSSIGMFPNEETKPIALATKTLQLQVLFHMLKDKIRSG